MAALGPVLGRDSYLMWMCSVELHLHPQCAVQDANWAMAHSLQVGYADFSYM